MTALALQKRNYSKHIRTYMMMTLVTMALAGYYGYTQYLKLSGAQEALVKEQSQISDLQKIEIQAGKDYNNLKTEFDQKYAGVLDSLQAVYPSEQNYTDLARMFDKFFADNNSASNPVFANDIKFGQPRQDAAKDFAVLPVTLTITGTQDNFMKFLKFVEKSGVLADKRRLMDIDSISINFTSDASQGAQPMLNVSVALNAYFQKPLAKSADAK